MPTLLLHMLLKQTTQKAKSKPNKQTKINHIPFSPSLESFNTSYLSGKNGISTNLFDLTNLRWCKQKTCLIPCSHNYAAGFRNNNPGIHQPKSRFRNRQFTKPMDIYSIKSNSFDELCLAIPKHIRQMITNVVSRL